MIKKTTPLKYPIDKLIESRWSPRSFNKDMKVEREKVLSICEAARWAPSCFNEQPWRFIVFDRSHNESDFKKGFDCLGEWNQKWAQNCSLLIAVVSHDKFVKNSNPNSWSGYDSGAAAQNMCLQATSLGLMSHQMGGFDSKKLINDFNIPQDHSAIAMIAFGYQAELSAVDEAYHEAELKERSRIELENNFFDGSWGKGI
ncbi:nitroreductase family protein [Candidatus Kapabacteria bacterium]|nr:nitroreductase family protein [Candidatus Kapabacteria bacterium]